MKQLAAGLVGSSDEQPELIDQLVACPLPLLHLLAEEHLFAGHGVTGRAARGADSAATTRSAISGPCRIERVG